MSNVIPFPVRAAAIDASSDAAALRRMRAAVERFGLDLKRFDRMPGQDRRLVTYLLNLTG